MNYEKPCEAPTHMQRCSGGGYTRDHFTPRSIAKKLGWSRDRINGEDNIQWLSQACHSQKDDPRTNIELETITRTGGIKTLWERHNEEIMLAKGLKAKDMVFEAINV